MENIQKIHTHPLRRVFYDILRDTNSTKYSMTKFASLVGLIALSATITMAIIIMWKQREIDHVLIVELIGFVLTLLGFKNSFGYKGTKDSQTLINAGEGELDAAAQKQLLTEEKTDVTNDIKTKIVPNNLKG